MLRVPRTRDEGRGTPGRVGPRGEAQGASGGRRWGVFAAALLGGDVQGRVSGRSWVGVPVCELPADSGAGAGPACSPPARRNLPWRPRPSRHFVGSEFVFPPPSAVTTTRSHGVAVDRSGENFFN